MEDNAKTIINVAGDYVQAKHVQYEIGNIEAGGIGFQIINGENRPNKSPAPNNKADEAILDVFEANICDSPDWSVVLRLFQERNIRRPNGLPYDAQYINELCGQDVTTARSISRSFMTDSVEGKFPNWRVKAGYETRESSNLLRHYNDIAKIIVDGIGE